MDAADEMQNATVSKLYDLFGDSENPKCGVKHATERYTTHAERNIVDWGVSSPPKKKDMDYGHALIPRKKILSGS